MESFQSQYEVILFAGGFDQDKFMYPLNTKGPTCLQQVANKTLMAYSLEYLEKYKYNHVVIVTNVSPNYKKKIQNYLEQEYKGHIKWELMNFNSEQEGVKHTEISALTSSQLQSKITRDFMILSCYTLTNINLHEVTDFHTLNNSSLTTVLKSDKINDKEKVPKPSSFASHDIFFISDSNQLGKVINQEIVEDDKELKIRKQILQHLGSLQIYTNLFDSHIYICKKFILNLIKEVYAQKTSLRGFQEDLLPFLVQNQINNNLMNLINDNINTKRNELPFYKQSEIMTNLPIFAYISTDTFCRRVNYIEDLMFTNQQTFCEEGIVEFLDFTGNNGNNKRLNTLSMVQIQGKQSFEDEQDSQTNNNNSENNNEQKCSLEEQFEQNNVSLVKSIIGKNVQIGKNVRIENSVIMSGVSIGDDSLIKNTFVYQKIEILPKNQLIHCQILENTLEGTIRDESE